VNARPKTNAIGSKSWRRMALARIVKPPFTLG
jgi:hypothetical protein